MGLNDKMAIGLTASIDTTTEDTAIAALIDIPDIVGEVGDETTDLIRPGLLAALQNEPPVKRFPIGKFPWTSERQRIFVIIKLKKANNLPYQRTGRLARSWTITTRQSRLTYQMIVINSSDIAKYVYGDFDLRSPAKARQPQQGFHQQIGWPFAQSLVEPELKRWEVMFDDSLEQRFDDIFSGKLRRRRIR